MAVVANVKVRDPRGHAEEEQRRRDLSPCGNGSPPLLIADGRLLIDGGLGARRVAEGDREIRLRRVPSSELGPDAAHRVELVAARRAGRQMRTESGALARGSPILVVQKGDERLVT